jgi:putative phage-type endonuclease
MMIDVEQGSAEWIACRLGKITSSRISDILAKGKGDKPSATRKNYMYQLLLERLTGEMADHYSSPEMQRGLEKEQSAADAYEAETYSIVTKCGFFESPDGVMSGSSPDRLVGDDGLIEIKNPNTSTHIETKMSGDIKREYILQMQHQMYCSGRKWVDFVSYDDRLPINLRLFIKRIDRDEKMIEEILSEVKLFLSELDELEIQVRAL